jgi:hypothetical protein
LPGLGGASANEWIAGVKVAVKRQVWRSFGTTPNRCVSSGAKLAVSSRSASSKTCEWFLNHAAARHGGYTYQELDFGQIPFTVVPSQKANKPPRSSNNDMGLIDQLKCLCDHVHSPDDDSGSKMKGRAQRRKLFRYLKCQLSAVLTQMEKSEPKEKLDLVGVKTKANMPYGSTKSFWSMGMANATVFPEPVFAFPMQSLPCFRVSLHIIYSSVRGLPDSRGGMHAICISVGTRIDMEERAAWSGGEIPKDEKVAGALVFWGTARAFVDLGIMLTRERWGDSCISRVAPCSDSDSVE